MIKRFKDKEAQKVFERRFSRRFSPSVQRMALRKLVMLDAADLLDV